MTGGAPARIVRGRILSFHDEPRLAGEAALTLIGAGGVASGADAYAKIRAGASAVQLYSALVYEGPGLIGRIQTELAQRLRADGFTALDQAVGAA